ncbi:hypothetical protein NM688_g2445 [Phlebia brevispora]|uniref:Uncharacterized protein n=1 Tax=Phlebia brevispora TaxID=194682 RepID=A0ACC1T8G5_9APHY|nr:hypothetical protein NM688_g2445 [Phlebia brevispora]
MVNTPFGRADEVPLSTFFEKLLPPLHMSIQLDELVSISKTSDRPKPPVTQNGRLWGYAVNRPSGVKGRRLLTFNGLLISIGKLVRAIGDLKPVVQFKNNNKAQWSLKDRTAESLPDAYFLISTPGGCIDWTTIAIPGAYSKIKTRRFSNENVIKITRCLSQCMHRDARRRFVYGFTAEDSTMRLWYCDRSRIVASDAFDFVTDWRSLFQFVLRVVYAERDDLGFDPSIRLLDTKCVPSQYEVKVNSAAGDEHIYHTLDMLSPGDADIVGRGTRVWKAVRINDGKAVGDPVALKDSWVSNRHDREGDVRARISESAAGSGHQTDLERSLLTVLAHGDVSVDGVVDCTRPSTVTGEAEELCGRGQVHYRIVYKEVCESLRSTASLFKVFKALGDVCHGLRALHECGWVHRDISLGNILLHGDVVKIADLEYAEKIVRLREHEHTPVGTNSFMANEVKNGSYTFIQGPTLQEVLAFFDDNDAREARGETPLDTSPFPTPPAFSYNPLHDLESLWWIAIYFIVNRVPRTSEDTTEQTAQDIEAQRKLVRDFFSDGSCRYEVIKLEDYFITRLACLHPSLRRVAKLVDTARGHLVSGYRTMEEDLQPEDFKMKHDVYTAFRTCFHAISSKLKDRDILVRRLEKEDNEVSPSS